MKKKHLIITLLLIAGLEAAGQSPVIEIKPRKFLTTDKDTITGEVGYITAPENRANPNSRNIKIKFIHLKSLSEVPREPVIYLEGGGNASTRQAESPEDLTDWLPILKVSDLIFVDQRGTTDQQLLYVWNGQYPENFLVSQAAAGQHYQQLCKEALVNFEKKGIDVRGYNIVEHAQDISDIAEALRIKKYSVFGFSFGTHIGMALVKLHANEIANAIFVGTDGLDQSFNYPLYLDDHFQKIAHMAASDTSVSQAIPDLNSLLRKVMTKLAVDPLVVTVKHPITNKTIQVKIGPFGLALVLRLDIDDANDIPVIPRLLYTIDQGDPSILEWFVQKRMAFAFAVPGNGINQSVASGGTEDRLGEIVIQAGQSLFGNVVNYPFYDAKRVWPLNPIKIDTKTRLSTKVRTLFITGSLDCRTPVKQVNQIMTGFNNAVHLVVENAGHEQAMWDSEIFDQAIPKFLLGQDVSKVSAISREIKFIPVKGMHKGHPSIR